MKQTILEKKVYYHDTDAEAVVYYANYLKYLEEGRSEHLAQKGIKIPELCEKGIRFVVVHIEIDYKSPARYADTLKIITRIEEISKASIHFYQEVKRADTLLLEAKVIVVCVGTNFKPKSIPQELKRALAIQ